MRRKWLNFVRSFQYKGCERICGWVVFRTYGTSIYAKIGNEEKKGQGYHYNSVLYKLSYIRLFYMYHEKKNHYQNTGDIILLKFCFLYIQLKLLAIVLVFHNIPS